LVSYHVTAWIHNPENNNYGEATLHGSHHFTLKMEAARSSETSVSYHITAWLHNPDDRELNHHCHGNNYSYNITRLIYFKLFHLQCVQTLSR
jgi:hypothetical protein